MESVNISSSITNEQKLLTSIKVNALSHPSNIPTFEEYCPKFDNETIQGIKKTVDELAVVPGETKLERLLCGIIKNLQTTSRFFTAYYSTLHYVSLYCKIFENDENVKMLNLLLHYMYKIDIACNFTREILDNKDIQNEVEKFKNLFRELIFDLYDTDSIPVVGILIEFSRLIFHMRYGIQLAQITQSDPDEFFETLFESVRSDFAEKKIKESKK